MHIKSKFVLLPPKIFGKKCQKSDFLIFFWCSRYFGQKMRLNLSEDVFFHLILARKCGLISAKTFFFFFWSWGQNRPFHCPLKISLAPPKDSVLVTSLELLRHIYVQQVVASNFVKNLENFKTDLSLNVIISFFH